MEGGKGQESIGGRAGFYVTPRDPPRGVTHDPRAPAVLQIQRMPWRPCRSDTMPFHPATLIAFAISFLIPFLLGIYLSFTHSQRLTDAHWVGIDNYVRALTEDDTFLNAAIFTIKFAVVSVVLINVLAFCSRSSSHQKLRGKNIFRTIFFMPNLIGGIILGYIWQLLINGVLINLVWTLPTVPIMAFWD